MFAKMLPTNRHMQQNWCHNMICLAVLLLLAGEYCVNGDSSIPHPCDNVKCPPLSDLTCPDDSTIRELLAEPLIAIDEHEEKHQISHNSSVEITAEIFSQCCLNQKCICKLCHIDDCHNEGEVVVELLPDSIDMPGFCCGKYECQAEPNCSAVIDTESFWLANCQRCKCYAGQRLCHQSCDTGIKKPALCHSKTLNTFYEHGQKWHDDCSDCECVNGEINCMITFCKGLSCPKHRQVQLKGSCCPVCWPKGFPMPHDNAQYDEEEEENDGYDEHNDIDLDYNENEEQIEPDIELKPISDVFNSTTTTTANTTTTTTTTSTTVEPATTRKAINIETTTELAKEQLITSTTTATSLPPCKVDNTVTGNKNSATTTSTTTTTTAEPCNRQDVPAPYQVYPQVVELMRYSQHNNLLYTIIGCLSVIVVVLAAWNIHLKAKQRSYRPVSNFDDNFNRMSSNIKKMNDYV